MQIIPQPIPTLVLVVPFLVTFVALWQILFKPLFEYLEDRDRVSREALAEAKHLRHDADARLADIEARIAAGRKEAADHRATARAAAQKQEAAAVRAARRARRRRCPGGRSRRPDRPATPSRRSHAARTGQRPRARPRPPGAWTGAVMRAFWIGLGLAFASAAVASEPAHGDAPAAHGEAPAAHAAGAHHTYTDDDDHDGTANWRDADSESYVVFKLGSQMGAFLIVVGIIGAFGRRPVADFLSDRALAIRKTLTDSAQARDDAKAHAAALSDRLGKLEAEIGQMRADAETEARQEAARLVERAEEEARRIEQVAERKIKRK